MANFKVICISEEGMEVAKVRFLLRDKHGNDNIGIPSLSSPSLVLQKTGTSQN